MSNSDTQKNNYIETPYQRIPLKMVNMLGSGLGQIGIDLSSLSEEKLCAEAIKNTGLTDFNEDGFREGLQALINAVNNNGNIHSFGKGVLRTVILHALENRLKIQSFIKQGEGINDVEIIKPLFVVGLPRTGTTLLFNLLSLDSSNRWLANWEACTPAPGSSDKCDINYRKKFAAKNNKSIHYFLPELKKKHETHPESPEECNHLFLNSFESEILWYCHDISSYREWLKNKDRMASYRFYKNQLKVLQAQSAKKRWLLKCPLHLNSMDALLSVFPDANIVQTHRDPAEVLPSACSLQATVRNISSRKIDYKQIGLDTTEFLSNSLNCNMRVRKAVKNNQILDIYYKQLITDPKSVIQSIYQYFGYELDDHTKEKIDQYVASNRQHKNGVHKYSLDQFSIDKNYVNTKFADYISSFDVTV